MHEIVPVNSPAASGQENFFSAVWQIYIGKGYEY
jgi:hypothetical protein